MTNPKTLAFVKSLREKLSHDWQEKFLKGDEEKKTQFETAGALWYANNLYPELLDAFSYFFPIITRMEQMRAIALLGVQQSQDPISVKLFSQILSLVSNRPPTQNSPSPIEERREILSPSDTKTGD